MRLAVARRQASGSVEDKEGTVQARAKLKLMMLPVALFAVACGRSDRGRVAGGLSDDLRQDLELASSAGVDLAASAKTSPKLQVVSAIEGGVTKSEPAKAKRSTKAPGRRPTPSPE